MEIKQVETKIESDWDLAKALLIIKQLQPLARNVNFHLALAGGVLNNGKSKKDLDIIALAMHNDRPASMYDLLKILEPVLGEFRDGSEEYDGDEARQDNLVIYHTEPNGRIDLFIYPREQE